MAKKDQIRIIKELCAGMQRDAINLVASMPPEWDGHELRQYLADIAKNNVYGETMKGKRLRDYNNTLLVNNL